jgi:hypothetical protein
MIRSMLTGEDGSKTLTIVADHPYTPQSSILLWQRQAMLFLKCFFFDFSF